MKKTLKWAGNIYVVDQAINTEEEFFQFFSENEKELSYEVFNIMIADNSGRIAGVQASFLNDKYKELIYKHEMYNYIPRCIRVPEYEKSIKVTIDGYEVDWRKLKTETRDQIIKDILFEGKASDSITCEMTDRELGRFCHN